MSNQPCKGYTEGVKNKGKIRPSCGMVVWYSQNFKLEFKQWNEKKSEQYNTRKIIVKELVYAIM